MRGRTSLKDANANCTWLNENRIAEETSGKIFSYQQKSLFCKAVDLLGNKMIKSKLEERRKK